MDRACPVHEQRQDFPSTPAGNPLLMKTLVWTPAGVQPRWIQGIRRVDGVGVERLVYLLI